MKKRFSMRNKLLIIFGLLIAAAAITEGLLAIRTARKAVIEKIETHLIDKATDTAEILDGRITAFFQFLEGIARMPLLIDPTVPYQEKINQLNKEASVNTKIEQLNLYDPSGMRTTSDGRIVSVHDRTWFQAVLSGKNFVSEPLIARSTNKWVIIFAVPVYDSNRVIGGILNCVVDALWLTDQIADIVVGKTGYAFILGATGNAVAHKNFDFVVNKFNGMETGKKDKTFESVAKLHATAIYSTEPSVVLYSYKTTVSIASYAKMKSSGWTIIISAPVSEFMGTVDELRLEMLSIGMAILLGSLIIVYLVARAMVKPITVVVAALKDIAQGEGDLTVRLPVTGNDEITDLSEYFNQTIGKIGSSIQNVDKNTTAMEDIGAELASNMTETASAVHQISANIDGVKQQALTQSAQCYRNGCYDGRNYQNDKAA